MFGEPAPDREKPFGCWFRILCHQQSCAVITLSLHCRSQLRQGVGEEQFQSKQSQTDFKGGGIRRSSDDRSTLSRKPWKVFAGTRKEPKSNRTLFNFNMKQGTELFEKIIAKHQLVNHGLNCTYQPRHGSTSTDVLTQHRSLVEVQKRGRWETTKSVRRYSNGGRISQVFNGLPEETKNLALEAEKWMAKTLKVGTVFRSMSSNP